MFRLLLLLLLGTVYAQKLGDSLLNDDDDKNLLDLNNQEDEDDMADDLETEPFDEFDLEDESGISHDNDTDELDDLGSQDDEDGMFDDLETNPDDHELEIQPDASLRIVDEKTKKFGFLRIFARVARTFFKAENFCRRRRGDLSSVHSRRINGRMRQLMRKTKSKLAWIGVWRPWGSGRYQNVDQTPMDYKHFGRGQCKRNGRQCVAMNVRTGRWCSQSCKRQLPFVCKCGRKP